MLDNGVHEELLGLERVEPCVGIQGDGSVLKLDQEEPHGRLELEQILGDLGGGVHAQPEVGGVDLERLEEEPLHGLVAVLGTF